MQFNFLSGWGNELRVEIDESGLLIPCARQSAFVAATTFLRSNSYFDSLSLDKINNLSNSISYLHPRKVGDWKKVIVLYILLLRS